MKIKFLKLFNALNKRRPLMFLTVTFATFLVGFIQVTIKQGCNILNKYDNKIAIINTRLNKQRSMIDNEYDIFAYKNRMLKDFDYTKHDLQTNLIIATQAKELANKVDGEIMMLVKAVYHNNICTCKYYYKNQEPLNCA